VHTGDPLNMSCISLEKGTPQTYQCMDIKLLATNLSHFTVLLCQENPSKYYCLGEVAP
jgi:hypothetical protein